MPRALDIASQMLPYIDDHLSQNGRLHQMTRHMMGLFAGGPGARQWRRDLSVIGSTPNAGVAEYKAAIQNVKSAQAAAQAHAATRQAG